MTQINNIDAKIFVALKSHMDDFSECAVYYSPDVPQTTSSYDPYAIVTDVRLDFDTRFAGSLDPDEYRGIMSISVMVPMNWSYSQGIGLASLVADHFKKGDAYSYDDCTVKVTRRSKVIGTPYQDVGMHRFPVLVYWRTSG